MLNGTPSKMQYAKLRTGHTGARRAWALCCFLSIFASYNCDFPAGSENQDLPSSDSDPASGELTPEQQRLRAEDDLYRGLNYNDQSVRMMPDLALRNGPGLNHEVIRRVPFGTRLQMLDFGQGQDTVLEMEGAWCKVAVDPPLPSSPMDETVPDADGWMFCPFIGMDWSHSGWVVMDGRAVRRNSQEFIEASGLDRCTPITSPNVQAFSEGCIGRPCYKCGSIRFRPDGKLGISDINYPGYCVERVGGSWSKKDGRIIARFTAADWPDAIPYHIMAGQEEQFAENARRAHLETYGVEGSDLQYLLTLTLSGSQAELTTDVTDQNRRQGFPDFGDEFDRQEDVDCFYPYTVPLDMFLMRE